LAVFRFKGISDGWQDFILCLLFTVALPALPLIIELWTTSKIEQTSVLLFASLYSLTVGIGSRSKLLFGMSIFAGLFFGIAYGLSFGQASIPGATFIAYLMILAMVIAHGCERYNMHVADRRPFFELFSSGTDSEA